MVYADSSGHTLYAWFQPPENLKKTCGETCMRDFWLPMPAPADLTTGTGWTAIDRPDGTKQLAYGGLPIYRFAKDAKAGDIAGFNYGYRADQQSGAWQPVKPWY
jgi:predicted lipoprotein with Yx(FWY)xxD motif